MGIGINVYNRSFPEDIADKATSILLENGKGCDRSWFIAQVSNEFEKLYDEFIKNKDLGFLVDEYNSYLVNRDKQVYVIEGIKDRVHGAWTFKGWRTSGEGCRWRGSRYNIRGSIRERNIWICVRLKK